MTAESAICSRLEIDLDDADAVQRAGFHVVDAAAQGEKAFEMPGNIVFDLFGRHAVVKRRHQHNRNVDGGEKIDRHLHNARNSQHAHDQAKYDDEIGIKNCELGHRTASW